MRSNYWSNSKFADWVRGTDKLNCGTSEQWRDWKKQSRQSYPIRYWIAEEGLDKLQNFVNYIPDKLYDLKYYINNRFVSRTHSLTAHPSHIRPGTWCDMGHRILPCLFDELVNFVEVELAWKNIAWDHEARKKYNVPFWGVGWFRWRTWRSVEAGLDYLKWEQSLVNDENSGYDPDHEEYNLMSYQAKKGKEVEDLYRWYKEVYLKRPDPMDASGWSEWCDSRRNEDEDDIFLGWAAETEEEEAKKLKILDNMHKIEQDYHNEDTDMLIRLIKIRESLWT